MKITKGKINTAQKIVIYGPEGIGKSTFASKFPNPLFTDTEGSTKHLDVNRFDRPTSEAMVIEQIKYLKAHPEICGTYVVDTADWLEKLCTDSVCASNCVKGIEDFGYGKGYVYVSEEFGRLLNLLEDLTELGINVVVTAHAAIRKFEQPDELGSYDRWEMKLINTPKCSDSALLKEWADAVFFVNYKTYVESVDKNGKKFKASGGRRVMYTNHHPCWDAKNRYGLPDEVEFDYSVISDFIPSGEKAFTSPENNQPPEAFSPPETVHAREKPIDIPEGIPKALSDLMVQNDVTEEDIRLAVSQRGYFPFETKIQNYGDDFINGCLIGAWDTVFELITQNKDLPF